MPWNKAKITLWAFKWTWISGDTIQPIATSHTLPHHHCFYALAKAWSRVNFFFFLLFLKCHIFLLHLSVTYIIGHLPCTSLHFLDLPQCLWRNLPDTFVQHAHHHWAVYVLWGGTPSFVLALHGFYSVLGQKWCSSACLLEEGMLYVRERQIVSPLLIGCANLL